MTDLRIRSDVQRLLDRLCAAGNEIDHASRLLEDPRDDAEFRRNFERYTAAGTRFEFYDLVVRAALDSIMSRN